MGEVQNAHHAEDHVEAGGHQKKHHPVSQPMNSLGNVHRSCWVHQITSKVEMPQVPKIKILPQTGNCNSYDPGPKGTERH